MLLARKTVRVVASLAIAGAVAVTLRALGEGRTGGAPMGADHAGAAQEAPTARPNMLVVTTDDQTLSQFSEDVMPTTWGFFRERGTVFANAIAAPPLCCPARAGFLTGSYPHNHGVLRVDAGYQQLVEPGNTLPVWLRRAGYQTGLIGKYLNGYPALGPVTPPGWDRFFAAGGVVDYFDFDAGIDVSAVTSRATNMRPTSTRGRREGSSKSRSNGRAPSSSGLRTTPRTRPRTGAVPVRARDPSLRARRITAGSRPTHSRLIERDMRAM